MSLVGGFGCLELGLYGIRELASDLSSTSSGDWRTLNKTTTELSAHWSVIIFSLLAVSAVILVLGIIRTLGPSSSSQETRQENLTLSRSDVSDRKSRQTTSWDRRYLNTAEILNFQISWLRMRDFSMKIKSVTSTFFTMFLLSSVLHLSAG